MTTIDHFIGTKTGNGRRASLSLFRLYEAAKWTLLWLPRFWKARSELSGLAAMSECERRDIGVTAFDIENALTLPVERDPTEVLAQIVDDRRHCREC
ncbi:hypothetical protein FJV76_03655 [Mesorhizobium sp. WSM4303]|uniref:hypothetical protein n=1 Tax=unclassified Mesorhizobium TaxID=325217 RepID=UPI00115DB6CC|nr:MULTISPECIES: hypothetical protein [unclassified Mesorhizobium]TRC93631.1 hypothetical protein FJV77_21025 [Mesorhizobium sp. WSM4306]TRD08619.1 hypothetical protein FJV76_03655 [Mesorhizobium sp. WSM4303]